MIENLSYDFKDMANRPKNRQINETGQKQGNFRARENFSARLSTENGDSFSLASAPPIIAAKAQNHVPNESRAR